MHAIPAVGILAVDAQIVHHFVRHVIFALLQRLEADSSKQCVYISQNCLPNGLPDVDTAISIASDSSNYALVGLSQALMLRSFDALDRKLDEVLSYSISGYGVVLLDHCEQSLKKFINRDIRVKNRVG